MFQEISFEEFKNGHMAAILNIRTKRLHIFNLHVTLQPDASHQVLVRWGIDIKESKDSCSGGQMDIGKEHFNNSGRTSGVPGAVYDVRLKLNVLFIK